MKYWKEGFYEEPQEGSVEITDEFYTELLDGQSLGSEICTDENGYPYLKCNKVAPIEEARLQAINSIYSYDMGDNVNRFMLGGDKVWLAKSARVGLVNSINIESSAGREVTNMWFIGVKYSLTIPLALSMLSQLELYALECYDVTQQHLNTINSLQTEEEITAYDHTLNYPEYLTFNI